MSHSSYVAKKPRELGETDKVLLHEAFSLFDADEDGHLDYYELKAAARCLGLRLKKPDLTHLFTDEKGTKLVSYIEFVDVLREKLLARNPLDEVKEAFRLLANESTNTITYDDLKLAADKVGADIPDRELRSMIEEFDTNRDGQISEQQFIDIMTGDI